MIGKRERNFQAGVIRNVVQTGSVPQPGTAETTQAPQPALAAGPEQGARGIAAYLVMISGPIIAFGNAVEIQGT